MGVTHHAVQRFMERHNTAETFEEARAQLEELAQAAVKIKQRSVNGQSQWRAGEIILVTKEDAGEHVVVTVLPPGENKADEAYLRLVQEYEEERASAPAPYSEKEPLPPGTTLIVDRLTPQANRARFNFLILDKAAINTLLNVKQMETSVARQREKTARYCLDTNEQYDVCKKVLRVALRFLVEHEAAHPEAAARARTEIAALRPDFLRDEFVQFRKG